MSKVDIILEKEITGKKPIIIEGFPGIGLIGNIVTQHIVSTGNFEEIGSIHSNELPPVAVVYKGEINHPIRIYQKENFVILVSDIPISPSFSNDLADEITRWAKEINTRKLISVAGISTMAQDSHRVFGAAINKEVLKEIEDVAEVFSAGNITGISGSILTQSLIREIPAISLLGETMGNTPDPRAAASVIKVLNDVYSLNIDTDKLLDQAEKIEQEMERLAQRMQDIGEEKDEAKKTAPPSMYR
ncbi:MAG: Archaeal enzyme of ATP-grasp superfamily [Candidatus Methanohalarchaeum thermophilum]|uniref:Archaeal enzyme of ATP-grasp superfamily n=1 Tax=Methanohalarchaeum thermophilum TaxID=1903181 RepID=A0A1Q6DTE2_METT1|nr:MAG: Archaeal enzyme of ATP-grasp superfamily [Candidatus Methanohalarchaeum thermophilum]